MQQLLCYSFLLLICAADPRIFILEGREIRELEREPEPIIILIGVVFFPLSLSILLVIVDWLYKLQECTKYQSTIAAITQF